MLQICPKELNWALFYEIIQRGYLANQFLDCVLSSLSRATRRGGRHHDRQGKPSRLLHPGRAALILCFSSGSCVFVWLRFKHYSLQYHPSQVVVQPVLGQWQGACCFLSQLKSLLEPTALSENSAKPVFAFCNRYSEVRIQKPTLYQVPLEALLGYIFHNNTNPLIWEHIIFQSMMCLPSVNNPLRQEVFIADPPYLPTCLCFPLCPHTNYCSN